MAPRSSSSNGSSSSKSRRDQQEPPCGEPKALVRWINGVHADTFTPNLNVQWIRDFNPENFVSTDSYTVEWRKPPMPKTGWPLLDCVVLEVSRDVDFLKAKMDRLREPEEESGHDGSHEERPLSSRSNSDSDSLQLRDILNTIRSSLNVQGVSQGQARRHELVQHGSSGSSSATDENQKLVKVGSSLVITNSQYIAAKSAPSPSRMIHTLVKAGFKPDRLRRSSYAGQTRNGVGKPALKIYKRMQDIQDFVKQRFPYLSQAAFGSAVNQCTGKHVDDAKKPDLKDLSDSESEL